MKLVTLILSVALFIGCGPEAEVDSKRQAVSQVDENNGEEQALNARAYVWSKEQLLRNFYLKFLRRAPDRGGYNFWMKKIHIDRSFKSCKHLAKELFKSVRYQPDTPNPVMNGRKYISNEEFVLRLYSTLLFRQAESVGARNYWMRVVAREGRARTVHHFTNSSEFKKKCR